MSVRRESVRHGTTRAAVFDRVGPPEVLRIADVPVPGPGAGQVRVRVRTAGVQPFDALVRAGHMDVPLRFPQQIGNEFTGTVVATGGDTSAVVGDEVLGWATMAAHADEVIADDDAVVPRPVGMDDDTAGAIGASGQTALTALGDLAPEAGRTLLVHGGAGGAGSAIVQIARHRGLRVVATSRPENHGALRSLGAIPVDYGPDLPDRLERLGIAVDAALTAVGGSTLDQSVAVVGDPGRVATLVDHERADRLGVLGVRARRSRAQLTELLELHRVGALRVPIRARFPLADISDAHRMIETGHGHGKIVLDVVGG